MFSRGCVHWLLMALIIWICGPFDVTDCLMIAACCGVLAVLFER